MNIKTITFDADQWQLVPKVMDTDMQRAWHICYSGDMQIRWEYALSVAPQPEPLSPWRDIESAPNDCSLVLVAFLRDGEVFYDFDFLNDGLWQLYFDRAEHYQIGGGNISPEKAPYTHWMPIPQVPEVVDGKAN